MKPQLEIPDLSEKGRDATGKVITLNRRLFIQFLAYGDVSDTHTLLATLKEAPFAGALYADINDPHGVGLTICHEDPNFFITTLRSFLTNSAFSSLTPKEEFTMLGRTYSIGYEADLENVLIKRPVHRITNPEWPWVVWYPLRRKGSFEKLPPEEQKAILGEHGEIGMLYSAGGYGHDIRLDCHGLDKNDNDFVIGLIGKELFPLSAMVQRMRSTRQTSEYLERLGPFFIGKAIWQQGQPRA